MSESYCKIDLILNKNNYDIQISGIIHNRDLNEILSMRQESERSEYFNNILVTGTIAIKTCQLNERVDWIKNEFLKIQKDLQDNFNDALRTVQDKLENVSNTNEGEFEENIKELKELINSIKYEEEGKLKKIEDSIEEFVHDRLKNMIKDQFEGQFEKDITELKELINSIKDDDLNVNANGSPLYTLREKLEKITESIEESKTWKRAREDTTGKGTDFENRFANILDNIVRPYSDNFDITKNKQGSIQRGFTGDFVVQLFGIPYRNKIVIETKSKKETATDYNLIKATDELDRALKNREASYAIMVFEGDVPDKLKGNSFISIDKMICTLNEFQYVYTKARSYLIMRQLDDIEKKHKLDIINMKRKTQAPEIINLIAFAKKDIKMSIDELDIIEKIRQDIMRSTNQLYNFEQDISKKLYQANRSIDHLLMRSEQEQKITKENLSSELDKENAEYKESPLINIDTSIQSVIESF